MNPKQLKKFLLSEIKLVSENVNGKRSISGTFSVL